MSKPQLYIKEVKGKGRAVFSMDVIEKDDLIEECPVIAIPGEDFDLVTATHVVNYCFHLDREEKKLAVAMGFGSLYNHSFQCNAHHIIDKETQTITIFALRDIAAHEEITINYNGEPDNQSDNWFASRGIIYKP
jgi:SET domain-containing protein